MASHRLTYARANEVKIAPPPPYMSYEPSVDSKGNWYGMEFNNSYIAKIDGKTKEVTFFKTPTARRLSRNHDRRRTA